MKNAVYLLIVLISIFKFNFSYALVPDDACLLPEYTCFQKEETYRGFNTKLEACNELLEMENARPATSTYYTPPIEIRFSDGLPFNVFQCVGDRYWRHNDQFIERGPYEQVAIAYNCPSVTGVTWLGSGVLASGAQACVTSALKCEPPFVLNGGSCELWCDKNESFDNVNNRCVKPLAAQNCKTQGNNPIDFIEGRKYRNEHVITTGRRFPFSLTYRYNNQRNNERSPIGESISLPFNSDRYLAATKPTITASEYKIFFTDNGVPRDGSVISPTQYFGQIDQYWRHNYDTILVKNTSRYILNRAQGDSVVFEGMGASNAYPYLNLQALTADEETFPGYKLVNQKTQKIQKFDLDGRLKKIERGPQDILTLTYDTEGRLDRITSSEGAFIQLAYQSQSKFSVYSTVASTQDYPVNASNDLGENADILWDQQYSGTVATFHLITRITEAVQGPAKAARLYEYNNANFPASLTDLFFSGDIASTDKQPILHFDYDNVGRAIYSGLSGLKQSDTVEYPDDNTRIVTNAFGKQATYTFAAFDGITRLKSVQGEPTQNCLSSAVEYEYDGSGNIRSKIQNGQITEYQYDALNRETARTEAIGTPDARTIITEYHPTLNKPVKITEPGKVTTIAYDAEGRLLSNTTQSTTAP